MSKIWRIKSVCIEGETTFESTQVDDDPREAFMRHVHELVNAHPAGDEYANRVAFYTVCSERLDFTTTLWEAITRGSINKLYMSSNDDDIWSHVISKENE